MTKVHFIVTEGGEELAIVPRSEYERLAALDDAEAKEDCGTARIVERALKAIAEGKEVLLPADVARKLMNGENPVRTLRKWRGLSQAQLAKAAGLTQSYLSDVETGRRAGRTDTMTAIAAALKVPIQAVLP